jgi:hypothetical protein
MIFFFFGKVSYRLNKIKEYKKKQKEKHIFKVPFVTTFKKINDFVKNIFCCLAYTENKRR